MLDLSGQTMKNAQQILKEKIENLEKQAVRSQYKLNTSIDHSSHINSQSDDKIYVFILPQAQSKDLVKYVQKSLQRQCHHIKDKCIVAVRISANWKKPEVTKKTRNSKPDLASKK